MQGCVERQRKARNRSHARLWEWDREGVRGGAGVKRSEGAEDRSRGLVGEYTHGGAEDTADESEEAKSPWRDSLRAGNVSTFARVILPSRPQSRREYRQDLLGERRMAYHRLVDPATSPYQIDPTALLPHSTCYPLW